MVSVTSPCWNDRTLARQEARRFGARPRISGDLRSCGLWTPISGGDFSHAAIEAISRRFDVPTGALFVKSEDPEAQMSNRQ